MSPPTVGLAGGVLVFWAVRLAYWHLTVEEPFSDMAGYRGMARQIYCCWSFHWSSFWLTYKPPVHPLLIAGSWWVSGGESQRVWQIAQSALILGGLLWLARELRLATGRPWLSVGLVWVVALARSSVFWSLKYAQETTGEAFIYLGAAAALGALRDPRWWRFALLGGFTTGAILNRPQFIVFVGFLPLLWLGLGRRPPPAGPPRARWPLALAFVAALLAVWAPWVARSYRLYHAFVPISTQGAFSFLWDYGRIQVDVPGVGRIDSDVYTLQQEAPTRFRNDHEAALFATAVARAWLAAHAPEMPRIMLERAKYSLLERTEGLTRVSRKRLLPQPWNRLLLDKNRWLATGGLAGLLLFPLAGGVATWLVSYAALAPWLLTLVFIGYPRVLEPSLPLVLFGNVVLATAIWRGVTRGAAAAVSPAPAWKRYVYELVGAEISRLTRHADEVLQWRGSEADHGLLLSAIAAPARGWVRAPDELADAVAAGERRTVLLFNGTFNHHLDIQGLLQSVRPRLGRGTRLVVVLYNPYLAGLYQMATRLRLRRGVPPVTFLTRTDLRNVLALSGLELVRLRPVGYLPFRLGGLGTLVNAGLAGVPGLRWLSVVNVAVVRPVLPLATRPSLSVVIPARNERGNIEAALQRMPDLGAELEILFVEGHSTDGTWEEIQRVARAHGHRWRIVTLQQAGRGKADAVRVGFRAATGELLTVLDADLTMPPELLGRFYEAYRAGLADFVNGSRLVYPMEGQAMRFLNRLGNVFFAKALSAVLETRIGDSLCGTKLLSRRDWERIMAWRQTVGDFDPFGDFELLFGATVLGLGIVDVPVRYRARTYGTTNIRRFRHGLMLLRMTLVGLSRIRLGRG